MKNGEEKRLSDSLIITPPEAIYNSEELAARITLYEEMAAARLHTDADAIVNAYQMIDLTSLNATDTSAVVAAMCERALRVLDLEPKLRVGGVCVYPNMIKTVAQLIRGSGIEAVSVAGLFPSGMGKLEIKIAEIETAIEDGATGIDVVLPLGLFLSGEHQKVFEEIAKMKEACGEHELKVILENCLLGEKNTAKRFQNIRMASDLCLKAGADFIKTSTGKELSHTPSGATYEDTLVMLDAIVAFKEQEQQLRGIKPAGGIKTAGQALIYLEMFKDRLGFPEPSPRYCRLGASSLALELIKSYATLTGRQEIITAWEK